MHQSHEKREKQCARARASEKEVDMSTIHLFMTDVAALLGLNPYRSHEEALQGVRERSDRSGRRRSKVDCRTAPGHTRWHSRTKAMAAGVAPEGSAIRRFEAETGLRCTDRQKLLQCEWTVRETTAASKSTSSTRSLPLSQPDASAAIAASSIAVTSFRLTGRVDAMVDGTDD